MDTYLGIFSTHPIQYQAPLWRKLCARENLRIHVYYGSDSSVRGEIDREFCVPVKWDVPLLAGYECGFSPSMRRAKLKKRLEQNVLTRWPLKLFLSVKRVLRSD